MTDVLFASYACGNRYYFQEGAEAPAECPHADCSAQKSGVYRDA